MSKTLSLLTFAVQFLAFLAAALGPDGAGLVDLIGIKTAMWIAAGVYVLREGLYTAGDILDDGVRNQSFLKPPVVGAILLAALLASAGVASAEPTPVNRLLLWDYTGPTIDGFRVYLAPEAEAPRVYSDARRVEVADPAARQVVVLDVNPTATNRICFRVTAYVGPTESDYSGEACGYFGIPGATNARVQ